MNRPAKSSMREFDSSHEAIRIVTRIIDLLKTMDFDKSWSRLVPVQQQTSPEIHSYM